MQRFLRSFQVFLVLWTLFLGTSQTVPADQLGVRLLEEAQILFDSAQYDQALQRGQQALEQFPVGEPSAGQGLVLLGNIFLETGQWEAAFQQYNAALQIFRQKLGANHLSTAEAINHLGEYFYKENDLIKALPN